MSMSVLVLMYSKRSSGPKVPHEAEGSTSSSNRRGSASIDKWRKPRTANDDLARLPETTYRKQRRVEVPRPLRDIKAAKLHVRGYADVSGSGVIESCSIEQVRRSLSPRTIIPTLLLPVPLPPGPPESLRCDVSGPRNASEVYNILITTATCCRHRRPSPLSC
jgi:hypothetical protein